MKYFMFSFERERSCKMLQVVAQWKPKCEVIHWVLSPCSGSGSGSSLPPSPSSLPSPSSFSSYYSCPGYDLIAFALPPAVVE